MMKKRIIPAVILFLMILLLIGSPWSRTPSQTVSAAGEVTVLFPDGPGFADQATDFTERTGLEPGPDLAGQFSQREPIGRFRSSSGLSGTFFEDALLLPALPLGQVSYIIYGTIEIPEGGVLQGQGFSGDYGIVVYGVPLVIVLVERETGELATFVVTSTAAPLPPTYALELLFRLITVSPSPPPAQPPAPGQPFFGIRLSIKCQELPTQQEIDVAVGSGETLVEVADGSGSPLFAVKEAGLGTLTISSFGPPLQFLVSALNYLHLGFVWAEQQAEVAIPVGPEFTLLVQAEEERTACIEAKVESPGEGEYHIVGTVYRG